MGQDVYQQAVNNFGNQAQGLGYLRDPYSTPEQQMLAESRFLQLAKAMMDRMIYTPGFNSQTPTAGMPFAMRNMYNAFGDLTNSPEGMMLMPAGSQRMLNSGNGYQFGGFGNSMSPLLNYYLAQQRRPDQPTQADILRASTSASNSANSASGQFGGGSPGGGGQPALPPAQGNTTAGTRDNNSNNYPGNGPTVPIASGLNDAARQIPGVGALISSFENNTGDLLGRSDTSGNPNVGGGIFGLSGINDMARAVLPGLGAAEDIGGGIGNALLGRGNQQGGGSQPSPSSMLSVNTQNMPLPRTMAILAQRFGINSIPSGINANDYLDNILSQALGGQ